MSYSQARMPNDVDLFPEPPLWLVWFADGHWSRDEGAHVSYGGSRRDHGQVRHCPSLEKAKRKIAPYGWRSRATDEMLFYTDWAIYKWEAGEYVLKFSGQSGEKAAGHPLWVRGVAKSEKPNLVPDKALEKALASLREAI